MVRTLVFDKLVNEKLKRLLDDNKSKTGLIIGFVSFFLLYFC
jgi:hypothetical protein